MFPDSAWKYEAIHYKQITLVWRFGACGVIALTRKIVCAVSPQWCKQFTKSPSLRIPNPPLKPLHILHAIDSMASMASLLTPKWVRSKEDTKFLNFACAVIDD